MPNPTTLKILKTYDDNKSLSHFYSNTCFLSKNFDDFQLLIQSANIDFDVIAISESRIIKNKLLVLEINLPDYCYKFCPTE